VLTTQARTNRLLQWGTLNTIVTVLAVVAGLPWGTRGVAITYAVSGVLIRTPLMFWMAGTVSSVRASDFYRAVTPFLFASTILLAAVTWFRWHVAITNSLVGLLGAFAVAGSTYLAVLWMLPPGRRALLDVRGYLAALRAQ
jgi:hypothetical protein